MQTQPRRGAYERPAAQDSTCSPPAPDLVDLDSCLAGYANAPLNQPTSVGLVSSSTSSSVSAPTFPCPLCTRNFGSHPALKRHLSAHDRNPTLHLANTYGALGFSCPECDADFNSAHGLSQHRRQLHATGLPWTTQRSCMQLTTSPHLSRRGKLLQRASQRYFLIDHRNLSEKDSWL